MSELKEYNMEINLGVYNLLEVLSIKKDISISSIINNWINNLSGNIKYKKAYNRIIVDPTLNSQIKKFSVKITENNAKRLEFIARNNLKRQNLKLDSAIKIIIEIIIYFGLSIENENEDSIISKYYPGKIIYIAKNIDNIQPGQYFIDTVTLKYSRRHLNDKEAKELNDNYFLGDENTLRVIRADNWLFLKKINDDTGVWRPLQMINYLQENYIEANKEFESVQKFKESLRNKNNKHTYLLIKEKYNYFGKEVFLDKVIYKKEKYKADEMDKLKKGNFVKDHLEKIYFLDDMNEFLLSHLKNNLNDKELQVEEN